jgi:hypothetical protein
MKKVLVRYHIWNDTEEPKFKVASTTNGALLRSYIGHDLAQFRDIHYLLHWAKLS